MKKLLQLLLFSIAAIGFAQDGTLDLSFNPATGAGNGTVYATALQADGKLLVGGSFTTLNNGPVKKLGRLNADGTLDASFTIGSGFNNDVTGIIAQPDGKILVVGAFTDYNGTVANRIIRLNSNGAVDQSFNVGTGANNIISAAALQSDGKLIVAGNFTVFNGTGQQRIVRLNSDGSADATFTTTGANDMVYTCVSQPDGKILLGGEFTVMGSVARKRVARLNADGTLDLTFSTGTGANAAVNTICLQPDGKLLIGGQFTTYNGAASGYMARINPDGTVDAAFNSGSGFDYAVATIVRQSDGKLLVGGNFITYNSISSANTARINADGTFDASFSATTGQTVLAIAVRPTGKIILGGSFSYCNNIIRNKIAFLNANGTLDTAIYPFVVNGSSTDGAVSAICMQPDGKILIGGIFNNYNGIPSRNIARLNTDGTLDTTFNVGTGTDDWVQKIAITPNNKVIIVGQFIEYNGVVRNRIVQLNADGSLDTSFNAGGTGADNAIHTVAVQSDGKIIIGGDFASFNGSIRHNLARLNANGAVDTSFNIGTGPEGSIYTVSLQTDGKIIIAGLFEVYNGTPKGCVARLNTNGTLDTTFNIGGVGPQYFIYSSAIQPDGKIILTGAFDHFNGNNALRGVVRLNANGTVDSSFNFPVPSGNVNFMACAVQNDGKILVSGGFTPISGFTGQGIIRLGTTGTIDNTFIEGSGFNSYVAALALQPDGKILAGGNFTSYNGVQKDYLVRLNASGNLGLPNLFLDTTKITLYPNPAISQLKYTVPEGTTVLGFEVFDTLGKLINEDTGDIKTIDIGNYSKGLYLLSLKTDGGTFTSKFIKQ